MEDDTHQHVYFSAIPQLNVRRNLHIPRPRSLNCETHSSVNSPRYVVGKRASAQARRVGRMQWAHLMGPRRIQGGKEVVQGDLQIFVALQRFRSLLRSGILGTKPQLWFSQLVMSVSRCQSVSPASTPPSQPRWCPPPVRHAPAPPPAAAAAAPAATAAPCPSPLAFYRQEFSGVVARAGADNGGDIFLFAVAGIVFGCLGGQKLQPPFLRGVDIRGSCLLLPQQMPLRRSGLAVRVRRSVGF